MKPLRRIFASLGLAAFGLLLVSFCSNLLAGSLSLAGAITDPRPLPTPPVSWLQDYDAYSRAENGRTRVLSLDENNGALSLQWELVSTNADPVVEAVAAGEAANFPMFFASEVSIISLKSANVPGYLDWAVSAPTITLSDGAAVYVRARADRILEADRVELIVWGNCLSENCALNVGLRTDQYIVAGLGLAKLPEDGASSGAATSPDTLVVKSRDANTASFTVGSKPVVVSLARQGAAGPTLVAPTIDQQLASQWGTVLQYVWPTLCFTVPWILLLVLSMPLDPGSAAKRNVRLALSGLLMALYVNSSGAVGTEVSALLGVVWAGAALDSLARSPRTRFVVRAYLSIVVVLGSAVIAWAISSGSGLGLFSKEYGIFVAVLGLVGSFLGSLLIARAVSGGLIGRGDRLLVAAAGAAAVGALAPLSATFATGAAWGAGVATLVFGAVFVATLLTVPAAAVIRSFVEGRDIRWVRRIPWAWVLLFPLCLWIVFPRRRLDYALSPLNPFDVYPVAAATVDAAKVALFAALFVALWKLSKAGQELARKSARPLALVVGAVMLLRPEVLFIGLPVSFAVGVWLLRRVLVTPAAVEGNGEAVSQVVRAANRHRLMRELERTLGQKAASGEKPLDEVDEDIAKFRDYAQSSVGAGIVDTDPTLRAQAFGFGAADPWKRGLTGAGVAVAAGFPGFLHALTSLSQRGDESAAVPVLSASTTIILILRYPLYGFFFGYFLPWLRGDTGVSKSLSLFAVLGVSEAIVLLLPYQQNQDVTGAFLAWIAQTFLICFALGVSFDFLVLRQAGLGLSALLDVHHTNRVVAFSSGVAAAAVTTLASVLATSAAGLIASKLGLP